MSEPVYDEDIVNLGFLKKTVSNTEENIDNRYKNVNRHYASKPNPPYSKGDVWIDGNIIYTCINSREIGFYTETDWVTESGAKEKAENKNKTYLTQPSDYSAGDMWILQSDNDHRAGKKGEILISTAGRKIYNADDWVNMLGYGTISSINEVAENLNNAINRIGNVEEAIEDGIIITFYQETVPEGVHIGDLWYVTGELEGYTKGKIYRYDGTNWIKLDDPAIQEAFDEANEARLVADGKIQSFYSETKPTKDMGVGDLWIDIAHNNELYRYNGTNWVAVYDTRINDLVVDVETVTERVTTIETDLGEIDLKVEENTTKITTVQQNITNLQSQIDGAIQFWNGSDIPTINNYPANEWTTEEIKNNHRADIYTVIKDIDGELKQGKSYRFDKVEDVWQWIELTDNELSAVQALATSKAKVFITTPIVPYNLGDLWINGGKLYRCKIAKDNNGAYSENDWEEAVDYTDNTVANLAKTLADTAQNTADSAVEEINNITNTEGIATGKNIHLEDSSDEPLVSIKVKGETKQDTSETSPSSDYRSPIENTTKIEIIDRGEQLLKNSSFEENLDEWAISNTSTNKNTPEISQIFNQKCLHITGELKQSKIVYQYIQDRVEVGKTYAISCKAYLKDFVKGTTNSFCALYFEGKKSSGDWTGVTYNSSGYAFTSTKYDYSNGFVEITSTITIKQDTDLTKPFRVSVFARDFTGDLYVYDLKLQEGKVTTAYTPYQEQKVTFPLSEGQKLYKASYLASNGIHHNRAQTTVNISNIVTLSNGNIGGTFQPAGKKYSSDNGLCCDKAKYDPNRRFVTDTVYENSGNVVFVGNSTDTLETLKAKYDGAILEYELSEEEIVPYTETQQEAWNKIEQLHTYKNVTNIFSDAELDIVYVRDNGLSDMYETKQNANKKYTETTQKLSEQKMTVDGVITQVSETNKRLTNDYLTAEQVNAELGTTKDDIEIIKQNQVTMTQTSKNLQIAIDTINSEGVTKVKTSMGYTFDDEGFKLNKSNAETGTIIDEAAVRVIDKTGAREQSLLYAGYVKEGNTNYPSYVGQTIVASANMIVQNYLVVPNSRFEEYTNPVLGGKGTGVFEV